MLEADFDYTSSQSGLTARIEAMVGGSRCGILKLSRSRCCLIHRLLHDAFGVVSALRLAALAKHSMPRMVYLRYCNCWHYDE